MHIFKSDSEIAQENKKLKGQMITLNEKVESQGRSNELLVAEVTKLRGIKEQPIDKRIVISIEPNSFLLLAKKSKSLLLPSGHRAFEVDSLNHLISSVYQNEVNGNSTTRYLTTEGSFAYVYNSKLLLEEKEGESVVIYEPLQEQLRQQDMSLIKVTFPKSLPIPKAGVLEKLGQKVDPEVEVVFE